MADDVIERCGDAVYDLMREGRRVKYREIARVALSALRPGDVLPNGCVVVAAEAVTEQDLDDMAAACLETLRPGDVLPNGCVVVEKSMVDTMASFSCGCEGACEYIGGEEPIPDQCLALSACRKSNINMDREPVALPKEEG